MASPTVQRESKPAASRVAPIGVLVVDDHPAVRRGAEMLIDGQPDMRVVAEARSAAEALGKLTRSVDVAVVDYRLGDGRDGLMLTVDLKAPHAGPRVLIYSAFADLGLAVAARIAGADGLVGKHELGHELCRGIRTLARDQPHLPAIAAPVAHAMRSRLPPPHQAIFAMLVDGIAPDMVADRLGITRQELTRRRRVMLASLTPTKAPSTLPAGARAPLDYERARRRPNRRGA